MAQWQTITALGAQSVADALRPGHEGAGASSLNLDGGGSVFLGIRQISGVKILARGGLPDQPVRPLANVMASEAGVAGPVLGIRDHTAHSFGSSTITEPVGIRGQCRSPPYSARKADSDIPDWK
ncbi:hypothetical protein KHF85_10290 [Xanthomonas translucens pv. graminis]|uniref:hypothetical protein n=1 Tax=Xanthomonas graminis TaxID=3390026 RepID=UPI0025411E2C|nr:hypothetical protein [Xanthomonas translucens]WIH03339.1 hypothetical protein KHF85_10290 [Xanthomonas translucens pv. graminis]